MYPESATALVPSADATRSSAPQDAGCSVLIHEATFDDSADGRANAVDKRHTTAGEAAAVAAAMGAEHALLTHFSARYPKLPTLPAAAPDGRGHTLSVAYDLMHVHARDLAALPRVLPGLHALFREEDGGDSDDENAGGV